MVQQAGLIGCVIVVLCMFAAAHDDHDAEAVMSCGQVQSGLAPCLGFLQGRKLVPQCCNGIKSLAANAKTAADRRAVCGCLQGAAKAYGKAIDFGKAATLPAKCRVNIPFKISPNTDCSRIR